MRAGDQRAGNLEMFGSLLRFYRERSGVTQEVLGKHVGFSKSPVAMVERGERAPNGRFIEIADGVLGAQGALVTAGAKLEGGRYPSWFEDYVGLEAKAATIHMYATHLILGLLQIPEYGRAVFANHCPPYEDDELEAQLAARLDRQKVLDRKPGPIVGFVLEEHVLRRPLGGERHLKEQLEHILGIGQRRNVEIQVMPTNRCVHAGVNGPMILLETDERKQFAYVDGPSGGYFVGKQPDLSNLFARYGILRAQALNPEESAQLISEVAGKL